MAKRGRPKQIENVENKKYIQTIYEFEDPKFRETGYKSIWHFDDNKSISGAYKVEHYFSKKEKVPQIKIEKGKPYDKSPIILVFKTNNKIKIKIFRNENIDYILTAPKLIGIPEDAIIIDCGVGNKFIDYYKLKYNI
jgi:hypothetical protein